jgi:hypothetical protein
MRQMQAGYAFARGRLEVPGEEDRGQDERQEQDQQALRGWS